MNAPQGQRSAIGRLLGLLGQPPHAYRPSTEIFLDLNVNRVADNWRPLIAVADLAGDNWPARARDTASSLVEAGEDESHGVQLLTDIRAAFESEVMRLSDKYLHRPIGKIAFSDMIRDLAGGAVRYGIECSAGIWAERVSGGGQDRNCLQFFGCLVSRVRQ